MKPKEFIEKIQAGELDEQLKKLYGNSIEALARQRARYIEATEEFAKLFPQH